VIFAGVEKLSFARLFERLSFARLFRRGGAPVLVPAGSVEEAEPARAMNG